LLSDESTIPELEGQPERWWELCRTPQQLCSSSTMTCRVNAGALVGGMSLQAVVVPGT